MKTLEKLDAINTLGTVLKKVETDMESVVRVKGVKAQYLQQELELVAFWLDLLEVDCVEISRAKELIRHKDRVEKEIARYKRKRVLGLQAALIYLKGALIEYRNSLLLEDGVYHTIRKGIVDGEDEVVKVVDGKVVWCDGYFYEEYDTATQDELYRVIEIAEKIRAEVDADFEEYSTTDES